MAVYNSPEDIKDAGLSEVTLELSAIDTTTIMERLVPCPVPVYYGE